MSAPGRGGPSVVGGDALPANGGGPGPEGRVVGGSLAPPRSLPGDSPYSPMVPSLMRWQSGLKSLMAYRTLMVPRTLLFWV